MLGFLFSKSDHALADAKEARRLLAELATLDAQTAIDHATALCETLTASEGFRSDLRCERLLELDEVALPQTRRMAREYFALARSARAQEFRLWQTNRDYWAALAHAYEACLTSYEAKQKGHEAIKPNLGLLLSRLLAAYAGRLKWAQLHYGPVDGSLWQAAGRAYLAAAAGGLAQRPVTLYAASSTTPEAEYLKLLVFHAASMDNLQPAEIEVAERMIAHFLAHFVFTAEVRPDNVYWVDAAQALPPTRLAKAPQVTPSLRFFSTGKAADAVAELRLDIAARKAVPQEILPGNQYSVDTVLAVLDHLAACWSPKPPMRSHARHRVESRLKVVGGMAALHEQLTAFAPATDGIESWVIADVSQGGMGALVPIVAKDWVRVGALVGMQPEGGANWLAGIVRRFARDSDAQGAVGIETISKTPRGIVADSSGLATEGILLDPAVDSTLVRVLVAASAWEPRIPLQLELDGMRMKLQPVGVIETNPDYVIGRYALTVA
jgi:hypothetical protein